MENKKVFTAVGGRLDVNYRWSFTARLHKVPKEIAAYYTQIKNSFLQYRKVKSRISWGCDTINFGREPLAKIVMAQKAVYVYLALNPKEYEDSKYFFKDFSDKKKFEKVPMRIKVRSERGVRYVLELIEKLAEKYELKPLKTFVAVDYALPNRSFERLLKEGLIKRVERKQAVLAEEDFVDEMVYEEVAAAEAVPTEAEVLETVEAVEAIEPVEVVEVVEVPVAESPVEAATPSEAETPKTETVLKQNLEGSIEDIEAEEIHVQFLERLCRQFDADEINAHVKVVYKKKNEKKTSIFDVLMKRNK